MNKVNVIYDIEPDYLLDYQEKGKEAYPKKEKRKNIKVDSHVFQEMLDKGLIRKTADGYVFVGNYSDLK